MTKPIRVLKSNLRLDWGEVRTPTFTFRRLFLLGFALLTPTYDLSFHRIKKINISFKIFEFTNQEF